MTAPAFIHLRVHSAYSLLEGAIHIKELVKWAKAEAMPAVAISDHGNLFGSLEFSLAAMDAGIQPIMATILYLEPHQEGRAGHHVKPDQLLAIAKNEAGWKNLIALSSLSYMEPAGGHAPLLSMAQLAAHTEGLIILTGGIYGAVGKSLLAGRDAQAEAQLTELTSLFPGHLYIELMRHGMVEERQIESRLLELAYQHHLPIVATNDAYFMREEQFEAHDAFLCIADGSYVSEDNRRRLTPQHRLKTPSEMAQLFADVPEALASSVQIARRCSFVATSRAPMLPSFTREGMSEADLLRQEARRGLAERIEQHAITHTAPYQERLEFEIETIIKMKFPGYFLIVSDFIKWSKQQGIPVGPGRGSGAGSLVAWALSITDLDPLRYGLLFERFLNPQRVSMPDFDVDFCQDRREEVIHYVQQKYGRDRVAQIITFGKLQARAVLRDVGRVLQMPYPQVDRICKLVPANPANPVTLAEAIEIEPALKANIEQDETVARLVDISLKLEGLNRHASTHAAGVVIADRPLSELVPMYRDPKSDMPVVQYSMKYAESAGLVKFDFLGLKTLSVLVSAVKMIAAKGVAVDLLKLPEGDAKTYALLGKGDAVGVFQMESAGMRDTLKKLKPDCLEDLIALVSLYRPGPMDNIPTYIARKHGHEKPEYLHPLLEQVLKETFGVIIYQEQVMQIAQLLAGYSLGEADLLRRAMGKKIKAEMEAQRDIFVSRAVERGIQKAQAKSIFDLIAKFAEYGFNKSHAAAYAVIAYQTAYLKANHPVEFYAATMNYDMHNTDKLGVFREDAAHAGIRLLPPDINRSQVLFSVEEGAIRYALAAVRNVGPQAMELIVRERDTHGGYQDIYDVMSRIPTEAMNKRALEFLIKAGAFDSIHTNRRQLYDGLDMLVAYGTSLQQERDSSQVSLFGSAAGMAAPKPKLPPVADWSDLERLEHEFSAIGFYLSSHPLSGYSAALKRAGVLSSADFRLRLDGAYKSVRVAGIVTGRKFKVSDKGRFAFIQLSDTTGVYEVSVFNEQLLSEQRDLLENGKILCIQADGKADESDVRLIAQKIELLDELLIRQQQSQHYRSQLAIAVSDMQALAAIRELLGEPQQAGVTIRLLANLPQGRAEIDLPGKYNLTPASLGKLRHIQGVVSAEEIAA